MTEQQRRRVRRAIDSIYIGSLAFRRAGLERRLPSLPDGRGWRTNIPPALFLSLQAGVKEYRYRGIRMLKHPIEIALYMQLLWEQKPGTVIEIGSHSGGTAVWIGDMLNTFGLPGRVVSIDLIPPTPPYCPANVTFRKGNANDLGRVLTTDLFATLSRPWLIIEDASHQYTDTLAVLQFFDRFLRRGEYIVVEDASVSEVGDDARFNGGPARAIVQFMCDRGHDYEIDSKYCDFFGRNVTGNPNGYLRKK